MAKKAPNDLPYRPCAGVMLINKDGKVFVGQRLDNPGPARQMPQGGIDKGEDPETAAFRELEEETGVPAANVTLLAQTEDWIKYDLPEELIGKIWKGKYRGQKQKWFLMRLESDDDVITIDVDHPEFASWEWADIDDLVDLIVPFKKTVYAEIVAAFRDIVKA